MMISGWVDTEIGFVVNVKFSRAFKLGVFNDLNSVIFILFRVADDSYRNIMRIKSTATYQRVTCGTCR